MTGATGSKVPTAVGSYPPSETGRSYLLDVYLQRDGSQNLDKDIPGS